MISANLVKIAGTTFNYELTASAKYRVIKTGAADDAKEAEAVEKDGLFVVPATGVTTLYSVN